MRQCVAPGGRIVMDAKARMAAMSTARALRSGKLQRKVHRSLKREGKERKLAVARPSAQQKQEQGQNGDELEARLGSISRRGLRSRASTSSDNNDDDSDDPWASESTWWEGKPAAGDLAINVALGISLIWLPLTLAALGRYLFVQYRVTDRRVRVSTNAPWNKEQLDASYVQVSDVTAIGRGLGLWGDMVITLKDNTKVELRSVPGFREVESYINDRVAEERAKLESKQEQSEGLTSKGFRP